MPVTTVELSLEDVVARAANGARFERAGSLHRWLIYGAGTTGRKWAACLEASGREVVGFIDRYAVHAGTIPVFRPETCPTALKQDCALLIGLHNPGVDVGAVKTALAEQGFSDLWLIQELIDLWPERAHFWLAPSGETLLGIDDIAVAHGALADAASRRLFVALLDQRLNGVTEGLPAPDRERTYMPSDLPAPVVPLRFIDCGAYIGDTVENFRCHGYAFEEIAAFEPDCSHYLKLCAALAPEKAFVSPCGVWNSTTQLKFIADDAASRIADHGSVTVQTVALDESLPNFAPNFLKMDIEGAERQALEGAVRSIARHRPRLAISAYHKPRDLWELLLFIRGWDLNYNFHLRSHSYNGFDTVLYALPAP